MALSLTQPRQEGRLAEIMLALTQGHGGAFWLQESVMGLRTRLGLGLGLGLGRSLKLRTGLSL